MLQLCNSDSHWKGPAASKKVSELCALRKQFCIDYYWKKKKKVNVAYSFNLEPNRSDYKQQAISLNRHTAGFSAAYICFLKSLHCTMYFSVRIPLFTAVLWHFILPGCYSLSSQRPAPLWAPCGFSASHLCFLPLHPGQAAHPGTKGLPKKLSLSWQRWTQHARNLGASTKDFALPNDKLAGSYHWHAVTFRCPT